MKTNFLEGTNVQKSFFDAATADFSAASASHSAHSADGRRVSTAQSVFDLEAGRHLHVGVGEERQVPVAHIAVPWGPAPGQRAVAALQTQQDGHSSGAIRLAMDYRRAASQNLAKIERCGLRTPSVGHPPECGLPSKSANPVR